MRRCVDCGKDISYRGNRAIRCEECQAKYRKFMMNRLGSARASKTLYRLYKLYITLTPYDLQLLHTITRNQLKYVKDSTEWKFLRTKLKLIDSAYKEAIYNGDTEATTE